MGDGVYGCVSGGGSNNCDNEDRYGSRSDGEAVGSDYDDGSRDGAGSSRNGGSSGGSDDFGDYDGWSSDDGDVVTGRTDDVNGRDDNDRAAKGMHEAATAVTMVAAALLAALVLAALAVTAKTVPKTETITLGVMYLSILVAAPMLLRLAYREEDREEGSVDGSHVGGGGNEKSQEYFRRPDGTPTEK